MKKLVLETTAPFQGLPELVAYDEGLFENEGLAVSWADRDQGVEKKVDTTITSPQGVNPFASHGKLFEQGKADMYNACEWGNYCRVGSTGAGSRQLGRRAIVSYAAMVVAPDSPVYTPQQLANRVIGVPFYFGTHYIAIHMLEGFLRRDEIKLCYAPNGSRYRLDAVMNGEIDAATLTEPHITLAEKKGCRAGGCRNLRRLQSGGARGSSAYQCQQARLSPLLHRLSRQDRPRSGCAQSRGSAGRTPRRLRPGADPA
jgi:NitT/TauT family transport system substrate-binding protein